MKKNRLITFFKKRIFIIIVQALITLTLIPVIGFELQGGRYAPGYIPIRERMSGLTTGNFSFFVVLNIVLFVILSILLSKIYKKRLKILLNVALPVGLSVFLTILIAHRIDEAIYFHGFKDIMGSFSEFIFLDIIFYTFYGAVILLFVIGLILLPVVVLKEIFEKQK